MIVNINQERANHAADAIEILLNTVMNGIQNNGLRKIQVVSSVL